MCAKLPVQDATMEILEGVSEDFFSASLRMGKDGVAHDQATQ